MLMPTHLSSCNQEKQRPQAAGSEVHLTLLSYLETDIGYRIKGPLYVVNRKNLY